MIYLYKNFETHAMALHEHAKHRDCRFLFGLLFASEILLKEGFSCLVYALFFYFFTMEDYFRGALEADYPEGCVLFEVFLP